MSFWDGIQHFNASEFYCKCGHCAPNDAMDRDFVVWLDKLRGACAFPFIITSGYRCAEHANEKRKRMPGSHHQGVAADILVSGHDAHLLLRTAYAHGVRGVGVNQKGPVEERFIHLDLQPRGNRPWIWSY